MSGHRKSPYQARPWPEGGAAAPEAAEEGIAGWHVVGPGVQGWRGTVPRSRAGMGREEARELAELLNAAYDMGSLGRAALIKLAIDGRFD